MAQFTVQAPKLKALTRALGQFPAQYRDNLGLGLTLAGELVVNAAKGTTAFTDRTGLLRKSIQHEKASANTEVVWPGQEYGAYVERGYKGPAKPIHVNPARDGEVPGRERKALAIPTPGGIVFRAASTLAPRAPRPFMVPALTDNRREINAIFGSLVDLTMAQLGM